MLSEYCVSSENDPGADPGDAGQRLGLLSRAVVGFIKFYQRGISPLLGKNCRFEPTCSQYMIACLHKYGLIRGMTRGIFRILRCHPFSKGGYDPP